MHKEKTPSVSPALAAEYLGDAVAKDDAFGRRPFGARIADTVANRIGSDSIAIGIYGPWGDGKSSVLGYVAEALQNEPKCVVIKFNPWRFSDEEALIRIFFDELSAAIRKAGNRNATFRERFKGLMDKKGVRVFAKALIGLSGVDGQGLDDLLEEQIEARKAKIEEMLDTLDVKLVFLIDDVDRLDPAEIHSVFRLVKLSAGLKRTVFVLAFDYDIVATALGTRFAAGGGVEDGRKYIEKIIQIPVELPKIAPELLSKYLLQLLDEHVRPLETLALAAWQYESFRRNLPKCLLPRLPTPRMCKRFANAVQFAVGMLGKSVDGLAAC